MGRNFIHDDASFENNGFKTHKPSSQFNEAGSALHRSSPLRRRVILHRSLRVNAQYNGVGVGANWAGGVVGFQYGGFEL